MAFYADWMIQYGEPALFFESFGVLFGGRYGGFFEGQVDLQVPGRLSGYRDEYQNNYPNAQYRDEDQGHHFAFFFTLGAQFMYLEPSNAAAAISVAAFGIELNNGFTNRGDIRLGIAAGTLGYLAATGAIPREHVGTRILTELCKPRASGR
jgi:hypothetical protein